MVRKITVILVENHTIVRQGFRRLLEERGFEIVGEAGDGIQGVRLVRDLLPDVVTMDVSLPRLGGIEATRRILKSRAKAKVIMLSIHDDESFVFKSLDVGACGYLVKDTAAEDLVRAINAVMKGEIYLSSNFSPKLLESYKRMVKKGKKVDEFSQLTNREREILQLIAEGYTSREIASMLFIANKTVDNHRANIMRKLDMHDTARLVRYAIRIGLAET
jgi:DNA-binding NarL/FixJ family response regulator